MACKMDGFCAACSSRSSPEIAFWMVPRMASRQALSAALLLALGRNLLQLALFSRLSTLHFSLNFPVIPLLLSAALYLLCRCVQRGRELQEDNDSII